MDNHVCPFLGTLDETYKRGPHVDYPSFENRCLAVDEYGEDEACVVMLSDQATFCLSSGHALCPRYQAAQEAVATKESRRRPRGKASAPAGRAAGLTSDWLQSSLDELDQDLDDGDDSPLNRRLWGWIGAVLIFLTVFVCGGSVAVFVGWQAVSSSLLPTPIDATGGLAAVPPVLTQQPLVLVITLTPASDGPATATPGAIIAAPTQRADFAFPPAVTATPGGSGSSGGSGVIVVNPNVFAPTPTLPPAPTEPATSVVDAVVDMNAPVPEAPTRRPTPTFEIPTSTPVPNEPTATATPTLGPPVVIFRADNRQLMEDECTLVRWNVQNVREVYYEGLGVSGQGSHEECISDDSETYTLMVVLGTGVTEIYTTTVTYLAPTPTPTFTPTWTPFPVYTPTWTPEPPPVTPTPVKTYGVDLLLAGGSQQTCDAGATCRVGVSVTNLGNQVDDLTVQIVGAGGWPAQLCRMDGVCAASALTIYNVGPGTAGTMNLVVEVPAGAAGETQTYTLEAASANTGGAVRSDAVLVELQGQ